MELSRHNQCCSNGGRCWVALPETHNFCPALWLSSIHWAALHRFQNVIHCGLVWDIANDKEHQVSQRKNTVERSFNLLHGPHNRNSLETWNAWAQFHKACKHTNLLSMIFFLDKKQDYQPNFNLLHIAFYWHSAVVCLSWKSCENLVENPVFIKEEMSC